MTAEDIATLGRRFFESQDLRRGGPDPALCTDDYSAHINSRPDTDLDGHDEFARVLYAAFPDMTRVFDDVIVAGDTQVIRFRLLGNHEDTFFGIPPSGQPIEVPCIGILKVRDGKVYRLDGIVDLATILQQIGAM
jgi:predicted ester cyclase